MEDKVSEKQQIRGKIYTIKKRSVGNTSPPDNVLCLVIGGKELTKHHRDIIEIGDELAVEKAREPFSRECEHLQWLLTRYVRNTKLDFKTRELALNQIRRSCMVSTLTRELLGEEIFEKHCGNAFKERASKE
tara:strand:+ start:434 stop:829 length:396 start_codon:yes stop_codon:yes gene_type:complete